MDRKIWIRGATVQTPESCRNLPTVAMFIHVPTGHFHLIRAGSKPVKRLVLDMGSGPAA
jgi:hypothetical protein